MIVDTLTIVIILLAVLAFMMGRSLILKVLKNRLGLSNSENELAQNLANPTFRKKYNEELHKQGMKCSIGNQINKNKFDWGKFKDNFLITDKEGKKWGKTLSFWLNWRNWVIISLIATALIGYGYWKGRGGKPVLFDLDYSKEFKMKLNGHYLVKPKNSQTLQVQARDGRILKTIRARDIPQLEKELKPIGFELKPVGIMGYGLGEEGGAFEGGAGLSLVKYYKWRLHGFLTNKGAYGGIARKITDNSALGAGVGKGWVGDNRVIGYYAWYF